MIGQLLVIAELITADQAGHARWKDSALLRHGIGARSQAAIAIAEMAADIESGPVIDALQRPRLERHVRRRCRRCKRKRAEPDAGECGVHGSAAAAHRAVLSSANIPAVSFVITAQICRRAATEEISRTRS